MVIVFVLISFLVVDPENVVSLAKDVTAVDDCIVDCSVVPGVIFSVEESCCVVGFSEVEG